MDKKNIREKQIQEIMEILTPRIERFIREYLNVSTNLNDIENGTKNDMDKEISKVLDEFCIPVNLKGYILLIEAIKIVINNSNATIGSDVYAKIADKYNSSSSKVERAIRTSIENAWLKVDKTIIKKWFGTNLVKKPTNSQFIFTIAYKMRNKML